MKFDKSKVYTALTADELKPGDIVITADNLHSLMIKVIQYSEVTIRPLEKIRPIWYVHRFHTIYGDFVLAYLVERKKNCGNCCVICRGKAPFKLNCCKDWKSKTEQKADKDCDNCGQRCDGYGKGEVCSQWKPKTNRNLCDSCKHCFAECPATPDDIIFGDGVGNDNVYSCAKYELKAEKHYRPFRDVNELIKVWCEHKCPAHNHRERELAMPYIWVKKKHDDTDRGKLIISFSNNGCSVIDVDEIEVLLLEDLFNIYVFLDGSPCGVEE